MAEGKEIEENEMGIARSKHGRVEKRVQIFRQQIWMVILNGRYHVWNTSISGKINLN